MSAPNNAENRELRSSSNKAKSGPSGAGAEGECETYLESHEGRECLKCPEVHVFPECLVFPVSEGQDLESELKGLAARNACTRMGDNPDRKRFKLARDVTAIKKRIGRALTPDELTRTLDQWYWLSGSYAGKTREYHLERFFAELTKVRVATGEGDTLNKALACVFKLSASELPAIPGMPEAPESWRRIAALHREVSRLRGNGKYFLSYRDAAKAVENLSHQTAHNLTLALVRLGVIKIVRPGDKRQSGRATEFRYLLLQAEKTRHVA
jgi:hypothetical protein